jgi:hypothetical protein
MTAYVCVIQETRSLLDRVHILYLPDVCRDQAFRGDFLRTSKWPSPARSFTLVRHSRWRMRFATQKVKVQCMYFFPSTRILSHVIDADAASLAVYSPRGDSYPHTITPPSRLKTGCLSYLNTAEKLITMTASDSQDMKRGGTWRSKFLRGLEAL